ncbi:MAG: DUF1727 domain-containing protein [Tissierellia bacterium]|nr:DUF1727 domain-containing protein [Tissierellia bacterium]
MGILARMAGRIGNIVGKIRGGGSSLPGYLALKIEPDFLDKIVFPKEVILVTGTNGKTSVTNMLAHIYKSAGYNISTNAHGANILQGIATVALNDSNSKGVIEKDVAILEVDEGYLPIIMKQVKPTSLIITNLFDDQADRFGSKYQLAEKIFSSIPEDISLYINGNDPILVNMSRLLSNRKTKYYGIKLEGAQCHGEPCPSCGELLWYTNHHYDQLGEYNCPCGFKNPDYDYFASDVDLENNRFCFGGTGIRAEIRALYEIYNMVAAMTVAVDRGIEENTVSRAIETWTPISGRLESIKWRGKDTWINLVKNPAGFNATLELLRREEKETYSLVVAVNNEPADGVDTTWYEKISWDNIINTPIEGVFVTGSAMNEMIEVLRAKGFKTEGFSLQEDLTIVDRIGSKPVFLANYTAMSSVKNWISKNNQQ